MFQSRRHHPEAPTHASPASHSGVDRAAAKLAPVTGAAEPSRKKSGAAKRRRPAHKLSILSAQGRSYAGRLAWVARDGAKRYPREIVSIIIANILGVSTAAGSLGGILFYAKHAAVGKAVPFHFGALHWHVHGDLWSLILFGGFMALLGVFSGACLYYTEWQIQRVTRDYQRFCAKRVLEIVTHPACRGWHDVADDGTWRSVKPLLHIRTRWTAFTLLGMLRCILPLFTFLGALVFLVYAGPWLTLMLAPLAAAYLVPLYMVNRHVSRNQKRYRELVPQVQSTVSRGLRTLLNSSRSAPRKAQLSRADLLDEAYDGMLLAYFNRLLADKRVVLLNTAFFVACLFVLFVYFGVATNRGSRSWAELVSYLVALRFAVGGLRHVSSLFLKFSRYFPEYRAYSNFVEAAAEIRGRRERLAADPPPLPERLSFRIRRGRWESESRLSIPRTGVLWALTPEFAGHFTLESAACRLEPLCTEPVDLAGRSAIYADTPFEADETLLANALGADAGPEAAAKLEQALATLGVQDEIRALPQGLRTRLCDHPGLSMSPEATLALHAGPALLDEPNVLLLSAATIRSLDPAFVRRLQALHASNGLTIIVDHRAGPLLQLPADDALAPDGVAVMDGPDLVGGGDGAWFKRHAAEVEEFLRAQRGGAEYGDTDDDDNDEDEDDDDLF